MICPFCKTDNDKVVDSRVSGTAIRRRRECQACGRRFTTREYIEIQPLTVVKRNGEKEPFQREKLIRGIMNSCKKRPLSSEDIEQLATRVENALPVNDSFEVGYDKIGNLVMQVLESEDSVVRKDLGVFEGQVQTNMGNNTLISLVTRFYDEKERVRVYACTGPYLSSSINANGEPVIESQVSAWRELMTVVDSGADPAEVMPQYDFQGSEDDYVKPKAPASSTSADASSSSSSSKGSKPAKEKSSSTSSSSKAS